MGLRSDSVAGVLAETGLLGNLLILEITETAIIGDIDASRTILSELRRLGVRVALDDFGTGYSSLSYLRQLPVDMVKIDQTFLRPVEEGSADPAFLQAIIRLADTLHLATICEGIETLSQLTELQATACGYGQGYFLARPGPLVGIPATIQAISCSGRFPASASPAIRLLGGG